MPKRNSASRIAEGNPWKPVVIASLASFGFVQAISRKKR